MLTMYPACIYKDNSGYSAVFPDLNYLATCGETLEECINMAIDCLAGYAFFIEKEGETLPMSSKPEAIDAAQIAADLEVEYTEAFVNVISVDVDEYAKKHFEKAVKKTLTVPYWLNKLALEKNINFSQVLQDALKNELGIM